MDPVRRDFLVAAGALLAAPFAAEAQPAGKLSDWYFGKSSAESN